jgi:serine/threonine-protein kinase
VIEPGMYLGDFKVIRKIGQGGMGEVWLARQETLKRDVAIKVLSPEFTEDKEFVERFLTEAQNAAKLIHPNIVVAHHAGEDMGMYYIAMEYVDGAELESLLRVDGYLDEKEALHIVKDIAVALEYAWDRFKIIHRDIKPSNIMMDDNNRALLMDMGISKNVKEENSMTMAGEILGTPNYMSPEQASSIEDIDFRSDIYSLGVTLFHLTTGKLPYNSDTAINILMQHINDPIPEPQDFNPNLSKNCAKLIKNMMIKDRDKRYSSWPMLIEDIECVLNSKPPKFNATFGMPTRRMVIFLTFTVISLLYTAHALKQYDKTGQTPLTVMVSNNDNAPVNDLGEVSDADSKLNPNELKDKPLSNDQLSFNRVVEYEVLYPSKYSEICDRYKSLGLVLSDPKYLDLARGKVKYYSEKLEAEKNSILRDLDDEAKRYLDVGDVDKAISVYQDYDGYFKEETMQDRLQRAMELTSSSNQPTGRLAPNGKRHKKGRDDDYIYSISKGNVAKLLGFDEEEKIQNEQEVEGEDAVNQIEEDDALDILAVALQEQVKADLVTRFERKFSEVRNRTAVEKMIIKNILLGRYEDAYAAYDENVEIDSDLSNSLDEIVNFDKLLVKSLYDLKRNKGTLSINISGRKRSCSVAAVDAGDGEVTFSWLTSIGNSGITTKKTVSFEEIPFKTRVYVTKSRLSNLSYRLLLLAYYKDNSSVSPDKLISILPDNKEIASLIANSLNIEKYIENDFFDCFKNSGLDRTLVEDSIENPSVMTLKLPAKKIRTFIREFKNCSICYSNNKYFNKIYNRAVIVNDGLYKDYLKNYITDKHLLAVIDSSWGIAEIEALTFLISKNIYNNLDPLTDIDLTLFGKPATVSPN